MLCHVGQKQYEGRKKKLKLKLNLNLPGHVGQTKTIVTFESFKKCHVEQSKTIITFENFQKYD